MNIVFRADASLQIGTGHVMRCLTLAEALKAGGAHCTFICREHPGNLLELIRRRSFEAHALALASQSQAQDDSIDTPPTQHAAWLCADWASDAEQSRAALGGALAHWLIVDHYALDGRWERALRPFCGNLMVIDDLADRPHDCDLLLDQNLGREARDYAQLVGSHCTVLAGPRFALLRPEFAAFRDYSLRRRVAPQLKHLLIAMGGVDEPNATAQVLRALQECPLPEDFRVSVVVGPHAPWLDQVRLLAAHMPWPTEVHVSMTNMAQLMADSDLAIGAAGGTAWERCCLGLPTLIIVLADNQRAGAAALKAAGGTLSLGRVDEVRHTIGPALQWLMQAGRLAAMSEASRSITDGEGARRVTSALVKRQRPN